jgi:beta-1,4-mannosyl-glycoprotein beta-1,4-N-acetylglucosaminyltransferase
MKIIDAFIFYNEVELLEYRINLLHQVVDYFVVVEATLTHVGKPKETYFDKSLLERFPNKIIYIVVDDLPFPEEIYDVNLNHHLLNEVFQRNCIQRGIDQLNLTDSDYIIVTDVDEIPDPDTIKLIKPGQVVCACLEQDLYYYNINSKHAEKWYHPKLVVYSKVKSMNYSYQDIRMTAHPVIQKGGWHLSYFGSAEFIANKIKNFSHQEYNNDFILNGIQEKIITCTDLYNRGNVLMRHVPISENDYLPPNYIRFTKEYQFIKNKYVFHCNRADDINEHLPTLYRYALECDSVFETGIRGVVSSYAFALGLMGNKKKRYLLNDISPCNIQELYNNCKSFINIDYIWCNNLHIDFNEKFDLTFIDTWHVYGQMKRELEKVKNITNKYIIMHDTTVDEWLGENIRLGIDATENAKHSGIPIEEIYKGIWPAISEFLFYNKDWILHERYTNNNGLTILKKIN